MPVGAERFGNAASYSHICMPQLLHPGAVVDVFFLLSPQLQKALHPDGREPSQAGHAGMQDGFPRRHGRPLESSWGWPSPRALNTISAKESRSTVGASRISDILVHIPLIAVVSYIPHILRNYIGNHLSLFIYGPFFNCSSLGAFQVQNYRGPATQGRSRAKHAAH